MIDVSPATVWTDVVWVLRSSFCLMARLVIDSETVFQIDWEWARRQHTGSVNDENTPLSIVAWSSWREVQKHQRWWVGSTCVCLGSRFSLEWPCATSNRTHSTQPNDIMQPLKKARNSDTQKDPARSLGTLSFNWLIRREVAQCLEPSKCDSSGHECCFPWLKHYIFF